LSLRRAESATSEVGLPFGLIADAASEDRGALAHSIEWHTQQQIEQAAQEQAQYQQVLARKAAQAQQSAVNAKQQAAETAPDGALPERVALLAPASTGSPLRRRSITKVKPPRPHLPFVHATNDVLVFVAIAGLIAPMAARGGVALG
jgi:hypothetical protein